MATGLRAAESLHPNSLSEAWGLLGEVVDPCSIATGAPVSITDMGIVTDVEIRDGQATVSLCLTSPMCMQVGNICEQVENKLTSLAEVESVECVVGSTDTWTPSMMAPAARRRQRQMRSLERPDLAEDDAVTRGDLLDRWFDRLDTAEE